MLFSTELLSGKIEKLEIRISELETENKSLCLENADLKDKLGLNSKTSSIPSSKEFYKQQKATKAKSNRSRGGQTGHQGSSRKKMQADEVINLELTDKVCSCGGKYELAGEAHIHQTVDIPEILPHVKEYHLNRYSCNSCGKKKKATLPKGVGADVFGPRINTIVGALTSFYKNSKRDVQNILQCVIATLYTWTKLVITIVESLDGAGCLQVALRALLNLRNLGARRFCRIVYLVRKII